MVEKERLCGEEDEKTLATSIFPLSCMNDKLSIELRYFHTFWMVVYY